MNNIDRILNFIDEEPTTPTDVRNEVRPTNTEQSEQQQQQQEQATEPTTEPTTEAPTDAEQNEPNKHPMTEQQYKRILRQIKNNIKRNRYPCTIEYPDTNMVFPSDDELKHEYNELVNEHRQRLKEERQRNINNYITKNKDSLRRTNKKNYNLNDDEILTTEDNEQRIYKKGPLKAIQHEEDIIEIPRTNKKDRKKIYETVKQNKESLKKLVKSETNNDFDINTSEALKNDKDAEQLYNIHHNNPFNNDQTWTRESFLKYIDEMIYKEEQTKQEAKQRLREDTAIRRNKQNNNMYSDYVISSGINPDLMKRY